MFRPLPNLGLRIDLIIILRVRAGKRLHWMTLNSIDVISAKITRRDDQIEGNIQIDPSEIDYVVGEWFNTDPHTGQLAKVQIERSGGGLSIQGWGVCDPEPCDWGTTELVPFLDRGSLQFVQGLTASWDLGSVTTDICCNIKGGILVIQTYNRFKDDSGRPNYFTKEFFHQISHNHE